MLTCEPSIGWDVHRIFLELTSLGKPSRLKALLHSPFTLHRELLAKIERETQHAEAGHKARLIAKINAVVEPQIIQALYRASQAGVRVDLIVRGMCSLRPGVPGVSDRIQVRSIVGRFLEHTRVYYFANAGEEEVYLSSADWMERNFFRRVETAFPVQDPSLRKRLMRDLKSYLKDNTQAWVLDAEGRYRRVRPGRGASFSAQQAFLEEWAEGI